MNYTTGLTYKPIMNRELVKPLVDGALVHLFEFTMDKGENDKLIYNNKNHLTNFVNGIAGRSTGPISTYRDLQYYNEEGNAFMGMPCTSIKKGFPFAMYEHCSNVGILIDPKINSELIYISGCDAYSAEKGPKYVTINPSLFKGEKGNELLKVNMGEVGFKDLTLTIPLKRSGNDAAALKDFFYNRFFDMYSGGAAPTEKSFLPNFISVAKDNLHSMNEIGANFAPSCIKAIVIFSSDISTMKADYNLDKGPGRQLQGATLAYMFNAMIEKATGNKLPVIHYRLDRKINAAISPGTMISSEMAAEMRPKINEVKMEPKKIAEAIKADDFIRNSFETHLGKEYVKELLTNKQRSLVMEY